MKHIASEDKIIISGSGISGLISALLLCKKGFGNKIVIVEKGATPGGLLRKYNYGVHGDFDYGMHNFLETGIKELDALIYNLLPENEWQLLVDEKRDLAGIFYNDTLQKNSPYFDLRTLGQENYQKAVASLLSHINQTLKQGPIDKNCTAQEFAELRFGHFVANQTILPSVQKIHRMPASDLDYMATVFTPMSRVVIADEPLVKELTESSVLRDFIAWSDQRTLPLARSSGRRAYYPKNYGAYRIVDAILAKLKEAGVEIMTNSEIKEITTTNSRVEKVVVSTEGNVTAFDKPRRLIWTANIPMLGRFLKTNFDGLRQDKPLKTVIVNILIDKPLNIGDLYYFFCYQEGYYTYRLTNYINYSSGAKRNGCYPICMELLFTEAEINSGINIEAIAENELHRFNILQKEANVVFIKAEILESGFPMPSRNNILTLKKVRNDIKHLNLNNLDMIGILAEDNLFFQTDVLIDLYNKLSNYDKRN